MRGHLSGLFIHFHHPHCGTKEDGGEGRTKMSGRGPFLPLLSLFLCVFALSKASASELCEQQRLISNNFGPADRRGRGVKARLN